MLQDSCSFLHQAGEGALGVSDLSLSSPFPPTHTSTPGLTQMGGGDKRTPGVREQGSNLVDKGDRVSSREVFTGGRRRASVVVLKA